MQILVSKLWYSMINKEDPLQTVHKNLIQVFIVYIISANCGRYFSDINLIK